MGDQVLCYVDTMGFNQKVQFPDGTEEYFPTEDLAATLVTACAHRNFHKVHLFGHEGFITEIKSDMEKYHNSKYAVSTLEIEVN